ncbi:MAG: hypothetical protein KA365_06710 [Arenimonas sp.]|nr:hypothetical protein [Arenimonas sp.]
MTNAIILIIAATLIWAYVVDVLAKKWQIPAVIPLIASGLGLNVLMHQLGYSLDWLNAALPVLGTIGLILIVLEGALDLKLQREKASLMKTALASAALGIFLCTVVYALIFFWSYDLDRYTAVLLAIPFAIISSAVAIPSSRAIEPSQSEFIVYESSISDILGVLLFFSWLDAKDSLLQFGFDFLGGGIFSLLLSVIFSFGLIWLLGQIKGHVRFLPILAMLFLLYGMGKWNHLSPLILVLGFGLMLNNVELFRHFPKLSRFLSPQIENIVAEFKPHVSEIEFGVRSLFFIMLGLWTPLSALSDYRAWLLSVSIVGILLIFRMLILKLLKLDLVPLIWLAPRGLITVLLILTAVDHVELGSVPQGAVMLTVLLTCFLVVLARPAPVRQIN